MKRWIAIVMSCVPLLASAASFWDGNATLQRGDSTFESGLYAASNSFAPDTEIEVENLETGKTARVIVRERAGSQSSILVLLAPKAAEALDIAPGTIARVRVTIPVAARSALASVPEDQPSNPDPDFNPAAAFGPEIAAEAETEPVAVTVAEVEPETQPVEVTETPLAEAEPIEVAATETQPVEVTETPAVEAAAIETPPAETELAETELAEAVPTEPAANPEDEQLLQELAARRPQKQLFLPPREDEKFAYQESVEPPAETVEIAAAQEAQPPEAPIEAAEQPAIESVEAAAASEPVAGAETALAEAQAPPEVKPELLDRISSAAQPTEKPAPLATPEPLPAEQKPAALAAAVEKAPSLALLAPETAQPKPEAKPGPVPEKTPDKVVVKPPEQKLTPSIPIAKAPPAASKTAPYYVQLAAYSAESLASGLAASLSATYPVLVLAPPPAGKQIYRVMIGPLNKAESGTLLNWFRYRGFPDAFVKRE